MSRIRRTDTNHADVLGLARQVGAEVLDLHTLPGGLDALIGFRSKLFLVEIKNNQKSASRKRLTPAEQVTVNRFRAVGCPVLIVETADDLLRGIGAIE